MALLTQGSDGDIQLQKAKEDSRMADWRTWKKGRKTTWHWDEFDGSGSREGIITEVHEDHAIMEADGMHLWIDDDTAEMFS